MPTAAPTPRLGFIRPLDGVRAFAVLAVMGSHTSLPIFAGGGHGVTVFFVLSGFLITTLLLEEWDEHNSISLLKFYGRRALRLFPALLAALAVVTGYALLFAPPAQRDLLLNEVLFAATYTTNFGWIFGLEPGWLYHTWTLAIEEQYYLVWPLILLAFMRRSGQQRLLSFIASLAVLIVGTRLVGWEGPLGLFRWTPEALLVGSAAALVRRGALGRPMPRIHPALLGLAASVVLFGLSNDGREASPGLLSPYTRFLNDRGSIGIVLFELAAAVLLLGVVGRPNGLVGTALSFRPLLWIGVRSYGIYIWHLPIFRFITERNLEDAGMPDALIVAVKYSVTFLVAAVSYAIIEKPALRLKRRLRVEPPQRPTHAHSAADEAGPTAH